MPTTITESLESQVSFPVQFHGWKSGVLRYADDVLTLAQENGETQFSFSINDIKKVKRSQVFLTFYPKVGKRYTVAFGDVPKFAGSMAATGFGGVAGTLGARNQVQQIDEAEKSMSPWVELFSERGVFTSNRFAAWTTGALRFGYKFGLVFYPAVILFALILFYLITRSYH